MPSVSIGEMCRIMKIYLKIDMYLNVTGFYPINSFKLYVIITYVAATQSDKDTKI
ncbi:hypothetical protein CFB3_26850 [Clostridium folliculivorans]|uniref:Uncharacterized protein n=1 Tax=Clostridium folliculivorans TaxID=2886038 RepID=A0A9W6D9M4_9CLOT|nr:hypothetical protein CFOLD11_13060 [Clostridium folliculivorans]GKU30578.1 hypothetical protein CFB3_26850 [Clostridium folliculivorans]